MEILPAIAAALWLGILTSISPCPLATNIAAVSYIGKRAASPRRVVLSGALYTLGRTLAYVLLGALIVKSLISAPFVSNLLQNYMNKILGPLLIVVGMFLLGLLGGGTAMSMPGERLREKAGRMGMFGAVLLGALFALAFCPVSAALFFGSLVPLALQHESVLVLPAVYGIGTALPVVVFSILLALGVRSLARTFAAIATVERWARRVTGAVFIGVGVYLSLVNIFGLFTG
jgi:cytochrome c biogenesis protein CcdA